MSINNEKIKQLAIEVIKSEADAIQTLVSRVNDDFVQTCKAILTCEGRIIVTGMGKSGHIGKKIAATLASTGTPSHFVHPAEANHGDSGMITDKDVIIMISYSGETDEVLALLHNVKRLQIPMICLTGNTRSTLAKASSSCLDISVEKEACPLGLAPTSSTTATLVMGDALAIALLQQRGFTEKDFALSHPGGKLGKRLRNALVRTKDLMATGDNLPTVSIETSLQNTLREMSEKALGITTIVNEDNQLLGIFTDGDVRRTFENGANIKNAKIKDYMSKNPKTIRPETFAIEALELMEDFKITTLVVTDDDNIIVGVLHMHDILRAGIV